MQRTVASLRLTVLRLANETPRNAEELANSIIGLEADVCAIRTALRALKEDLAKVKKAVHV
jgi:hypothetical protein